MRPALVCFACLVVLGPAAAPQESAPPEGFTALFDGKSLAGWKMVNTKDNFFVKDGVLVMNGGKGWLATEQTFADFELRIHYRFVTPGADSGVFIRSSLEGKNWTSHGYQIQNMDNDTLGRVIGMGIKLPPGSAHADAARVKANKKPTGQWQDLSIRAFGKTVAVKLNGQDVASGDQIEIAPGHIGLQAEGGVLEFKRVDIRSL